jgi:hypothetical protein
MTRIDDLCIRFARRVHPRPMLIRAAVGFTALTGALLVASLYWQWLR